MAPLTVAEYHERTKHRLDGYARGPATLDWDAQPLAFRWFEGALQIALPLTADHLTTGFAELGTASVAARPWARDTLALLLEISLGLSAWKHYGGAKWSLRCNPSSGNLHPTEGYLLLRGIEGLADGLYHYRPDHHALELRCRFSEAHTTHPIALLALSSIHWREAWKYGERAYRYCQLDVGHALAAVSFAAAALGQTVEPLYHLGDNTLSQLLGLDRSAEFYPDEAEHPDLLLDLTAIDETTLAELPQWCASGQWYGRANRLDLRHDYQWPLIEEASAAALRPAEPLAPPSAQEPWPSPLPATSQERAADLFRQRRSAQAFDGQTPLAADAFFRMLDQLLPRNGMAPWSTQPWPAQTHLALFVHRVEGVAPGLYLLVRSPAAEKRLRESLRAEFAWERLDAAPAHLPLYRLIAARAERTAARLACQQAIAGDSAFSLAMLAEFADDLSTSPWRYRERHWEAGAIGQVLYLEAEAAGVRGTGIGCFFDDALHELLGITTTQLQVIYCFTVGTPQHDPRLVTLPPYTLQRQRSD